MFLTQNEPDTDHVTRKIGPLYFIVPHDLKPQFVDGPFTKPINVKVDPRKYL